MNAMLGSLTQQTMICHQIYIQKMEQSPCKCQLNYRPRQGPKETSGPHTSLHHALWTVIQTDGRRLPRFRVQPILAKVPLALSLVYSMVAPLASG